MDESWIPLCDLPTTHLADNLELCRSRWPDLAAQIADQASREDILISHETQELARCKCETETGTIWISGAGRPVEVEVQYEHDDMRAAWMSGTPLVLLFGVGLGYSVKPLVPILKTPQVSLIAVEPDPGVLYASFCLFSWRDLLDVQEFHLITGDNPLEAMHHLIRSNRYDWIDPERIHITYGYPWRNPAMVEYWDEVILGFGQGFMGQHEAIQSAINEIKKSYPPRKDSPEKVLFLCSNSASWGPIIHGLACGFEAIGCSCRTVYTPAAITRENIFIPAGLSDWRLFEERLLEFRPDLVVVLNISSNFWLHLPDLQVPRVVWVVDPPANMPEIPFHPMDYVILSDLTDFDESERRGATVIGEAPMAAFKIETEFDPEFACDLSFVGTLPDTAKYREFLPVDFLEWMDAVVETYFRDNLIVPGDAMAEHGPPPDPGQILIEKIPRRMPSVQSAVHYLLCMELNRRRRLEVLSAVADLGLRIYGNPEWERAVASTALEPCWTGRRLVPENAYKLYRSSKISVNIHTVLPHTTVNQRDMEVPSAGGFLISDLARYAGPRSTDFFDSETEVPAYSRPEELRQVVQRYLADKEAREMCAKRAQERVRRDHNNKSRAESMIQLLQKAGAWR
ncbi:MAG: glycosyltransferase [bacterium]